MERKIFVDETLSVSEVIKPKIEIEPKPKKISMMSDVNKQELSNTEILETFIAYGNSVVDLIPTQKANSGTCKYCGKSTSKVQRHLCVDCFKINADTLYQKLSKAVI